MNINNVSNTQEVNGLSSCPRKRKRFYNPHIKKSKRRLIDFLLWPLGYYNDEEKLIKSPEGFEYPNPSENIDASLPWSTWINHSTFLIQCEGIHILTDPIWGNRCSPSNIVGPKRLHQPPIELENLPKIDVVLISHNHYDHLDKKTVKTLIRHQPTICWVAPLGVKKWLKKMGARHVIELSWWESQEITFCENEKITLDVTAVPSQHFSGRGLFDTDKTLWVGYVFSFKKEGQLHKKAYFVGDTGYNPHDFVKIGQKLGPMDLSLIPIGAYVPFNFMAPVHICPNSAVEIHQDVRSKLSIGMHWKTFRLSSEGHKQPPYDLFLALKKAKLDPSSFRVIDPGQTIHW